MASLALLSGGTHVCGAAVTRGGTAVGAKENISTGEWVALIAVVSVGALAFLALLLFTLVFPLINRIAKTHIPCLDIFSSEEKAGKEKSGTRQRATETADGKEGYADDRYVKTVRIDTLYNPEKAQEITASSIDRAVRQAARENSGKKKK